MRAVAGRSTLELTPDAFRTLAADHSAGLLLDLGTGDGKHVQAVARHRPDWLVVGADAAPDAMRRTAARAAQRPVRGGLPNALFLWASAEQLPDGLDGVTEVHALMPWGSLLRALVEPDVGVLAGVAARCAVGARFLVTLNLHAWRPPVPETGGTPEPSAATAADLLGPGYARAGWTLEAADDLDAAAIAALGTSWTKRIGASRDDQAVLALRGRIGAAPLP